MANPTYFLLAGICLLVFGFFCLAFYQTNADPDFEGWHAKLPNGPFWQLAMLCFLYANLLSDVAFIRLAVVLGILFMTAWTTFGCPPWPLTWFTPLVSLPVDQFIWGFASLLTAGIPMWRQFRLDDSKVEFAVPKEYKKVAEAMWSDWFCRSGIPRADFNIILEAGDFLELHAGEEMPMFSRSHVSSEDSYPAREYGDTYYYVLSGEIECQVKYNDGHSGETGVQVESSHGTSNIFLINDGEFLDAFALSALFGHASGGLAMQSGPMEAKVVQGSTSTKLADRFAGSALVMRWHRSALIDKVLDSNGFAVQCMRLVVSQAMVDQLFTAALPDQLLERYKRVNRMRKDLNLELQPPDAAQQQRPLWRQFLMSHVTLRDIWQPSPHQRAVNAARTGSREMTQWKLLSICRGNMQRLRSVSREL